MRAPEACGLRENSSQWALKTVWGVGYKFELAGAPRGQRRADKTA